MERSVPSAASTSPPDTDAGSDGLYHHRSGDGCEAVRGWSTEVRAPRPPPPPPSPALLRHELISGGMPHLSSRAHVVRR